jgi:hypothetical protein
MSRDDELRDILAETAKQISHLSPNPRTWLAWLVYLLDEMESEATTANTSYKELFRDTLSALEDAIRNRRNTGGW